MDRKSIIIVAAAVLVLFLMSPVVDHFFPPKQVTLPLTPTNGAPTNISSSTWTGSNAAGSTLTASTRVTAPESSAAPEQTLTVSNDDAIFVFTSRGGGLKSIALKKYPAVISRTGEPLASNMVTLNNKAPAPMLDVSDDRPGGNDFVLTQQGRTVRAEKTFPDGLQVIKEFDISSNYYFTSRLVLTNTTEQPLSLHPRKIIVGTATPVAPLDDPTTIGTFWYDGRANTSVTGAWFANRTLGCIPGTPRTLYEEGASNVVWTAVHSQYFTVAAIPDTPAPRVSFQQVELPPPDAIGKTNATTAFLTNGIEASLWYPATILPPHQRIQEGFSFFAGPKEYNTLAGYNLKRVMDFGRYTGFFSEGLLTGMNMFHSLGLGYGWTIIFITLVIKGVFWPLTRASTRSQKRLQALQPQINAIAEKYKDDPSKKNQKTMDFMREHKVSPLGSCLPMVIQIPVFFGFYWMLRNAIELRGMPFLWAHDLSQPDTIFYIADFPVNPLPIIMGATQFWQSQLLPPSPGMDPAQQKLMRYFPLLFVAMFYKMSAGLTLYWTVSNLLSILQTKLTRMADEGAAKPGVAVARKKA